MVRYLVALGVALGLVGCRETLPPVAKPVYKELTQEDVTATARRLVELRGLKLFEDPKVMLLSRSGFEKAIDATHSTEVPEPSAEDAFPALLGLLAPSARRKPQLSEAADAKKHVGGFYEHADKTVRMPNVTPASRDQDLRQRAVLAHELHHAMQYQNFTLPEFASIDALDAWKGLIEGDASMAELVHTAHAENLSVSRVLRRARYDITRPTPVSPLASPVGSSEWESLPLVSETLRLFPYRHGLAFVVDLYRAGGFALVDRAYARPPRTTEHILHPEKYLADERPRPIATLEPPAGWKLEGAHTMGELRTRVFLEPCLGKKVASDTAAGWHGDRAFVLSSQRSFMLGWVSSWDTEEDAVALEDALARMGPCLPNSDVAGKGIAAAFSIRRRGAVVAFARGGEHAERDMLLERLLPLPGDAPAPSPVSTAKIPPLQAPPEPRGGELEGDIYRNDFFGISVGAPSAFDNKTWAPEGTGLQLPQAIARKMRAGGAMGYSLRLSTPEHLDRIFAEAEEDAILDNAKSGYETTPYESRRKIATGLGTAYEQSWTQRRGVLVHRITVIPICGGTGHIRLSTKFSTVPGRELMDYWVQSFRWLDPKKRPPVCEYFDPESVDRRSNESSAK